MNCRLLSAEDVVEWAACIPQELFTELLRQKKGLHAIGVSFLEEAQGALVWEETEQGVLLESLYVRPQARRLGLGSALLRQLFGEAKRLGARAVSVLYTEEGERRMLTPFLAQSGFVLDAFSFPAGHVTLGRLTAELLGKLGKDRTQVRPVCALSVPEQRACAQWLERQLNAPLTPYLGEEPASFAVIRGREVQGAVLVRRQEDELSLDYCWVMQNQPVVLAKLLACSIEQLSGLYAPETVVRMTLATEQAQKLFCRLFGQPQETTVFCGGSYTGEI